MINMPSMGEEYHGTWRSRSRAELHDVWRSDIPLIVNGIRAGHVRLAAAAPEGAVVEWVNELMIGLRPFEEQLRDIVTHLISRRLPAAVTMHEVAVAASRTSMIENALN
jgi:UDP-GlcNAc:undecaprenyl-phosphate GlcNAc-1-phosphate transferase